MEKGTEEKKLEVYNGNEYLFFGLLVQFIYLLYGCDLAPEL